MTWGTQLFLSRDEKKRYSITELEQKLTRILKSPGLNRLIFWNTRDDEYSQAVVDLCRINNVECWLWFPLLADPLIPVEDARLSENHRNQKGVCSPGCMSLSGDGEEEFSFVCPSDENFINRSLEHLDSLLQKYPYSGAFLDRIRFPSYANGFPLQFTCLCDDCCASMGLNRETLASEIDKMSPDQYLNIFGWRADSEWIDQSLISEFVENRTKLITNIVKKMSRIVRKAGRGFALDLFSPSLSRSVGQNYRDLSLLADWIKPMTYAMAWGPAGLPMELDCLYTGLKESFPGADPEELLAGLEKMMGHNLAPYWETRHRKGFPFSLVQSEWKRLQKMDLPASCSFIPGIELVHSELFQTQVPPDRARDSARMFSKNSGGIIASWNCLDIPEDYFKILDQG